MKPYLLSLGAGLLVGALYALMNIRSPAPPAIALLGLMGILLGEQAVPIVKRLIGGTPAAALVEAERARQVQGSKVAAKRHGPDGRA